VVDHGTLTGIDNQVDITTGTLKLKAEFPNASFQLWPGQFVNVRLKVETLSQALVIPTSAVQRGPVGTFSYVIGEDDIAKAVPVTVTQQNETEAVIAKGLTASDRVVTTGFANLADGAKVVVGTNDQTPTADLAPRKRGSKRGEGGPPGEHRGKRGERGDGHPTEGNQPGQTETPAASAPASTPPSGTKQP
jgi:multidrug efflux system membrane fusion protein